MTAAAYALRRPGRNRLGVVVVRRARRDGAAAARRACVTVFGPARRRGPPRAGRIAPRRPAARACGRTPAEPRPALGAVRPARGISTKNAPESPPSAEARIRRTARMTTASNRSLPGVRRRQAGAGIVRRSTEVRFSARPAAAPSGGRGSAGPRLRRRTRVGRDARASW